MLFPKFPLRTVLALGAVVSLAAAGAPGLLAQAPAKADAAAAAGPKLVVVEDRKDVGTVPKGEPIKHVFVLRNTGTPIST
jgi:hypothetical protein